ncbi:MAG: hypothetical protein U0996_09475 [Planctomycetaceae bacterium]
MQSIYLPFAVIVFAASFAGCDNRSAAPLSQPAITPPIKATEREEILDAVAEAKREAQNTVPPAAKITLATPDGWTRTEPRPLPPSDNGFTVGYEHESGLTVTPYQFTRGLNVVPNELDSAAVQEEMQRAKSGIEQAVQLGYWHEAREVNSGTVGLGDSSQKALWSQYNLTVDGATLASDIYVWSHADTFFKLRCTCRTEDVGSNQTVLQPLLTAFGSPIVGDE